MNKKLCSKCKREKEETKFYKGIAKCRDCMAKIKSDHARKFKAQCIDYKGGKCKECGYNEYMEVLEFRRHPNYKHQYSVSKFKSFKFDDYIKKLLDQCDLVCANCMAKGEDNRVTLKQWLNHFRIGKIDYDSF